MKSHNAGLGLLWKTQMMSAFMIHAQIYAQTCVVPGGFKGLAPGKVPAPTP